MASFLNFVLYRFIQCPSDKTVRHVEMLGDMHIRNIREKVLMLNRAEEAAQQLEVCC